MCVVGDICESLNAVLETLSKHISRYEARILANSKGK